MGKTDNELIAEFMGIIYDVDPNVKSNKKYYHYNELMLMSYDLRFESSWDWLMPVVDKICEVCKPDSLEHYWWNDAPVSDIRIFRETLNETFFAVVTFIKWYNSQRVCNNCKTPNFCKSNIDKPCIVKI